MTLLPEIVSYIPSSTLIGLCLPEFSWWKDVDTHSTRQYFFADDFRVKDDACDDVRWRWWKRWGELPSTAHQYFFTVDFCIKTIHAMMMTMMIMMRRAPIDRSSVFLHSWFSYQDDAHDDDDDDEEGSDGRQSVGQHLVRIGRVRLSYLFLI